MGKKILFSILLIIGLSCNGKVIEATTTVSGSQSGIWTLSNSPYVVIATVTIPPGETLSIESGITVRFATATSLVVYGTLSAVGYSNGTITFTSHNFIPRSGDWKSIKFSGSESKGTISYCLIEYGNQALYLENAKGITITYNIIRNNKGEMGVSAGPLDSGKVGGIGVGIYLDSSTNNTIIGNTLTNNQGGQGGHGGGSGSGGRGGIGTGIYLSSSTNNTILENTISNSKDGESGYGDGLGSNGSVGNGYGIYIDSNSYNNTIDSTNTYNGESIHYYYGTTTPTMIEYQTLTLTGSGSTNLGRIVLINCSNFSIRNNFITGGIGENGISGEFYITSGHSGRVGGGIYLISSTNNTITGNTISNNQGGQGGSGSNHGSGGTGGIGAGIYLISSTNNTITGNTISNNQGGQGGSGGMNGPGGRGGSGVGIYLLSSPNNIILDNILFDSNSGQGGMRGHNAPKGISGNNYGLYIDSNSYNNTIGSRNTYNGEPIHYYYGITTPTTIENQTLTLAGSGSTNLGRIVLINCSNFIIRNNYIAGGIGENGQTGDFGSLGGVGGMGVGIYLGSSTYNNITGNTIGNNQGGQGGVGGWDSSDGEGGKGCGIHLDSSDSNKIIKNTIWDNMGGNGNPNGNGVGIHCKSSLISPLIYNNIYNNQTYNLQTDISPGTQIAEYNWWGADPPDTPKFSGNIDYTSWLKGTYTGQALITIRPTFGTVGTFVTVSGAGFSSTELIQIDFGTTVTITIPTTDILGMFNITFTVNTQSYGTTSIIATGLISGTKTSAYFFILSNITSILPSCGPVGTNVTVTGNGFGASESIRIEFGTTPSITFASTNSNGEFQVVFTANSQPIGTTTIVASGLWSGGWAIAHFYILPDTILKIIPAEENIPLGATFTTQVELLNVTQLFGGDIHLKFDPNILQVINIGSGTFPANPMIIGTFSNTTGWIHYGFFLMSGGSATGSGVVCNIVFKGVAGGKSDVVFESEGNHETKLVDTYGNPIPFTKQEAFYRVINKVAVYPEGTIVKAGDAVNYTGLAYYGTNTMDVTGSTTFTLTGGGGSFTTNTFLAKYIGTYTIVGEYLGFIETTTVIIIPGTPTTLIYVAGNNQVNTCTLTLKEPFTVKVVDNYGNPCPEVEVIWEIMEVPVGATGATLSSTRTTTNIAGTVSSFLTLGTEPPGTYTIYATSTLPYGSPYVFTAHSLRRFGNIAGYCLIDLGGTRTLGSVSVQVKIVELNTTTTTQNSYFTFEKIPVGSYTLHLDTTGASPANVNGVHILPTQFEDTTNVGTISLLAGDVQNDGQVNMEDWSVLADAWTISATETMTEWQTKYIEADFDHNGKVNIDDIYIFSQNFGRTQTTYRLVKKIKPTRSEGKIELSFNLETLEGVDLENLRIGDIINLKVYVREGKGCMGGEVHLSFNPAVLQVVNEKMIPGDYPTADMQNSRYKFEFENRANNSLGVIDYAVGITAPEPEDGGLLVEVPFKIISNNAFSKIGCDFKEEENRQTMFIERTESEEKTVVPEPEEIIIKVPAVFNNLNGVRAYPNPAKKGQVVTFDQLTSDKWTTLRIYNLAGELVYEGEGKNKITWELKNKDGENVASGIYIYFLKDELGATKKGKVGVIK